MVKQVVVMCKCVSVTDVAPKPRRHGNRTASSNPQAYQVGAGCALGAQNMLPKRVCAGRAKSPGLACKTTMKKNVASLAKEAAREVILGTPGFETDYKAAQKTDGLDQAAQVRYWRTKMEGSGAADGQDGQDAKKRKAVGNAKLRVKLLESAKNAVSGGKAISKLSVPQLEAICTQHNHKKPKFQNKSELVPQAEAALAAAGGFDVLVPQDCVAFVV